MKYLAFFFLLSAFTLSAQDNDLYEDLSFYGDVMVNAVEAQHRERAATQFNRLFDKLIDENDMGIVDLSRINYVSQIYAPDSSFSMVTWYVALEDFKYSYYGCFMQNGKPPVMLTQSSAFNKSMQYEFHDAEFWYGALYYNLIESGPGEYLIFGYNANGEFENAKVADYLIVDEQGFSLGKEVFQDKEDPSLNLTKLFVTYSADASVNLNYNAGMNMIVHDHLQQRMGRLPNQGPTFVPDGTYEGYVFQEGKWVYKEKLFDHSYGEDNAPRPKPVLDKRKEGRNKK